MFHPNFNKDIPSHIASKMKDEGLLFAAWRYSYSWFFPSLVLRITHCNRLKSSSLCTRNKVSAFVTQCIYVFGVFCQSEKSVFSLRPSADYS